MEELGKALKTIFDKLSDFFDIFDLSFLVSGVATTLSVVFWLIQRHVIWNFNFTFKGVVLLAILIWYINGLISFAAGRWIRMGIVSWLKSKIGKRSNQYDEFDKVLIKIINAHGLQKNKLFKDYLSRKEYRGTWRLYVRLWAVIRENKNYTNSLSLLKRYWVMAATYDGLSISIMTILILFLESWIGIIGAPIIISPIIGIVILILLIFFFLACIREADRYVIYQMEEVIGTISATEK
jgi:hypothetical protein